ncbi:hypothetical protein TNCV_2137591 [Trichonephila clavipes]|nr:hypothetical protein TNCV_2137591 [Trichonephila clavipes]
MGGDLLVMYVIVGGVSLHVINDIQANSVPDVSPTAQELYTELLLSVNIKISLVPLIEIMCSRAAFMAISSDLNTELVRR